MKIEQSEVSLSSSYTKEKEVYEIGKIDEDTQVQIPALLLGGIDRLELSNEFQEVNQTTLDEHLMRIIRTIEFLTGEEMNLPMLKERVAKVRENTDSTKISYTYDRVESTKEQLGFSASGNVKTADGKEINFALATSMKYKHEVSEKISATFQARLVDPLVINFDTDAVTITDVKHDFDLDLDGKSDTFSFVGDGSGFLAYDKNKDGIINDGSELFGPNSGNGFRDLAGYDADGNGWIDENDSIYKDLMIWTKDEDGKENLYSLQEKNIGALYLNRVDTSFDLRVANNEMKGQLKESSIFLKEDGEVGTLQEIDLVI